MRRLGLVALVVSLPLWVAGFGAFNPAGDIQWFGGQGGNAVVNPNYASSAGNANTAGYAQSANVANYAQNANLSSYAQNANLCAYATQAGSAASAATALSATMAQSASSANTCSTATSAQNANTAAYATAAGTATSATTATQAQNANTATYAQNANLASYAQNSNLATYAQNSNLANYAQNSNLAAYAQNANLAAYAQNSNLAAYAQNANTAATAAYAQNSNLSTYAQNSNLSTYAQNANVCSYATLANAATNATNATNATLATFLSGSGGNVLVTPTYPPGGALGQVIISGQAFSDSTAPAIFFGGGYGNANATNSILAYPQCLYLRKGDGGTNQGLCVSDVGSNGNVTTNYLHYVGFQNGAGLPGGGLYAGTAASPNGVTVAPPGSLYVAPQATVAGQTLWQKATGGGNGGWVAQPWSRAQFGMNEGAAERSSVYEAFDYLSNVSNQFIVAGNSSGYGYGGTTGSDPSHPGNWYVSMGNTNGYAYAYHGNYLSAKQTTVAYAWSVTFQAPNAMANGNNTWYVGPFAMNGTAGAANRVYQGAFLQWDAITPKANFQIGTANGSTQQVVDSGVAAVAASWHTLVVTVPANSATFTFTLDNVVVGSITDSNFAAGGQWATSAAGQYFYTNSTSGGGSPYSSVDRAAVYITGLTR